MYLLINTMAKILSKRKKKSMASNPRNIFPEISEILARSCVPYFSSHSLPWRPLSQL